MKALVLKDYNVLEVCEVPDPVPGLHEVLVRVKACGICGSDVHGLDGSTGRRIPPLIMGHEAAGEVAALGKSVHKFKEGDPVTFDSTVWCGECGYCRSGAINLCDRRQVLGVACPEFRRDGAFAEFVVVPERILVPLPHGLSYVEAALAEPLAVALHAVGRLPGLLGKSAAVFGTGIIGLLVVQAFRAAGCAAIYAVDQVAERLQLATEFGATATFCVESEGDLTEAVDQIRRETNGGTDVAVEAVGIAETVSAAIATLRKGGSVVLVGNLRPHVDFPLQSVVTREISVLGSCASRGEFETAVKLIAQRTVNVRPLISAVAPLEEGPAWFLRLRQGNPGLLKVVLQP